LFDNLKDLESSCGESEDSSSPDETEKDPLPPKRKKPRKKKKKGKPGPLPLKRKEEPEEPPPPPPKPPKPKDLGKATPQKSARGNPEDAIAKKLELQKRLQQRRTLFGPTLPSESRSAAIITLGEGSLSMIRPRSTYEREEDGEMSARVTSAKGRPKGGTYYLPRENGYLSSGSNGGSSRLRGEGDEYFESGVKATNWNRRGSAAGVAKEVRPVQPVQVSFFELVPMEPAMLR
jgi:hypothetical protein